MKRLLPLAALLFSGLANASYDFDGANDEFRGDFGVGNEIGYPVTIGIWVKYGDHPQAIGALANFGNNVGDFDNSHRVSTDSTDGRFRAFSRSAAGAQGIADYVLSNPASLDDTWFAVVVIFRSNSDRQIYVQSPSETGTNTTSVTVSESLRHISIGEMLSGSFDFTGKLAELAIWSADLSSDADDLADYMDGSRAASAINNANLAGYWPLDTENTTQTDQSGNGGPSIVAAGDPTFDADHPTISSGDPDTQIIEITSIAAGSPCDLFNDATDPDIVAGDELHAPLSTSPGGTPPEDFLLTILPDCTFSYTGDGTKQTANVLVFDTSAGDFHADDIDFVDNNNAPVENGTLGSDPIVLKLNEAMTSLDICSGFDDVDGDQLTITRTGDTSGTHDGANNAAVLTDSGEAWSTNRFVNYTLANTTDGSSCVVTENTATTVTCTLTGGAENDWDAGDAFTITGALPTGTDLSGTGNCSLGGTPTVEDEMGISLEFTATDDAEEFDTVSVTFYVVDTVTVPTYVDLDSAITLHQETFPWQTDELALLVTFACHDTAPANDVISQDPAPDAEIEAFDPVSLTVSMGICPIRKKLLMLTR